MPSRFELIMHPVRLQIITTMALQRMTVQQLSKILDTPQTTLYRHINILVENGIIKVVEEKQKRGTVERLYAVSEPPNLTAEELRGMQPSEYEQTFVLFITTLLSDMQLYLRQKQDNSEIDILADGVDVSKVRLYLSDNEFKRMQGKISEIILAAMKKKPTSDRKARIFSYLFIPGE